MRRLRLLAPRAGLAQRRFLLRQRLQAGRIGRQLLREPVRALVCRRQFECVRMRLPLRVQAVDGGRQGRQFGIRLRLFARHRGQRRLVRGQPLQIAARLRAAGQHFILQAGQHRLQGVVGVAVRVFQRAADGARLPVLQIAPQLLHAGRACRFRALQGFFRLRQARFQQRRLCRLLC